MEYGNNFKSSCFIGIGSAGSNTLRDIAELDERHKFIHINSDELALSYVNAEHKILIDKEDGDSVSISKELQDNINILVASQSIIYVILGIAGNCSQKNGPKIIKHLISLKKDVVVFALLPFKFEGSQRIANAKSLMQELEHIGTEIIPIDNNFLMRVEENMPMNQLFKKISNQIFENILNKRGKNGEGN